MTIFALLSIPLLACGLALLARTRQWMEAIHLASATGSFVAALFLAAETLRQGSVSEGNGFLYVAIPMTVR